MHVEMYQVGSDMPRDGLGYKERARHRHTIEPNDAERPLLWGIHVPLAALPRS